MPLLQRTFAGIRIERLTPDLLPLLRSQASRALNGDGTCSLSNMNSSCFASELCTHGRPSMKLDDLEQSDVAYVAICDVQADGFRGLEEGQTICFVGCVTFSSPSQMVKGMFSIEDKAAVVSNLCVAEEFRKFGVGRKLLEKVLGSNDNIYLLVKRNNNPISHDMTDVFDSRVERLLKTYEKLSFTPCARCPEAYLLKHTLKR